MLKKRIDVFINLILPKNFILKVKFLILNFTYYKKLLTKSNIKKILYFLQKGEFRQVVSRLNDKLFRNADKIALYRKIVYLNSSLRKYNIIFPKEYQVDIIMPIYNAYEYTQKSIQTVFSNTDIEYNLILVNDCSTDSRIKIFLDTLKEKNTSKMLNKLLIINNEQNLGFIKSVNLALKTTKNDVILLNTDTEVPLNWTSRLMYPIFSDKTIASVTPFSNCAIICSFPDFCKNNLLFNNMSIEEIDKIFSEYGGNKYVEIPTGVGFCMAMNRECIEKIGIFDTVYGKGYGEENDWCRRAVYYKYKNVMVTNLFVYHKHGVSFNEAGSSDRENRMNRNLLLLEKRHRGYSSLISNFVREDPIKDIREFLKQICLSNTSNRKGILFINHSSGGGATAYIKQVINEIKEEKRVYLMSLLPDEKSLEISIYGKKEEKNIIFFSFNDMNIVEFNKLMLALNINYIFINELVNYPVKKIIKFIRSVNIPYTFFIHDFYSVCPEITLLNNKRIYCNAETNSKICNTCLKKLNNSLDIDIIEWRNLFDNLLFNANEVIVPSKSTKKIINKYYPRINIKVKEHKLPIYIHNTYREKFVKEKFLNITVLGAIGENKGAKLIYELVDLIRQKKLPIRICVIGITCFHSDSYISKDNILKITGRYDNKKVSELLAKNHTSIVLLPAICPETYSYTANEAIFSGYPVMVFDIGAPADRVRKLNCGWIIDKCDSKLLLDKLLELLSDRNKIIEKSNNIGNIIEKNKFIFIK